nr:putative reverse transcriptase domain-containing protein [Tanacetum cinerariifolium]
MPSRRLRKKSVKKLEERRVAKAIEEYEKTRADSINAGGSGSASTGGSVDVQGCSYKTFMNWKPHSFNGTEGVIRLKCWFEKMKQVFEICKCTEDDKVKFSMCTLEGRALTSFKIDLLPTRLGSFDVIIGMDWLSYHRAVIDCYEEIVRIPLPNGEILEVQGERLEKDPGSLACIKADEKKLDDIRVVQDFPEIFPDDLSGLPPVREIEFRIDLIPGALPIVKLPYRLAPSAMSELSSQLKELQEKGFIRPSHSPWGAPVLFVKKKDGAMRITEKDSKSLSCIKAEEKKLEDIPIVYDFLKAEHQNPSGLLQQPKIPKWKWENITMDLVTRIPRSSSGYEVIWVIVDRSTKSAYFLPIHEDFKMERLAKIYISEIVVRHEDMLRACIMDFRGSCDTHPPLVEFSYNNNYHKSIKCTPFEALYGRKCRSPVIWAKVRESQLIGHEIVQETTKKILQIKERLKTARDHQKSYDDMRYLDLQVPLEEIKIDDKLYCIEKPIEIVDRRVKKLKQSWIPIVKVRWDS